MIDAKIMKLEYIKLGDVIYEVRRSEKMSAVIDVFRKKTESKCPICSSDMYMVYWRDKSRSFMCIKCFFGFNYKPEYRPKY